MPYPVSPPALPPVVTAAAVTALEASAPPAGINLVTEIRQPDLGDCAEASCLALNLQAGQAELRATGQSQPVFVPLPDLDALIPPSHPFAQLPVQSPVLPPASLPLDLTQPLPSPDGAGQVLEIPTPDLPASPAPADSAPASPAPGSLSVPIDPAVLGEVLEVRGDRQEFDERRRIFKAEGNVEVRFRQGILTADRVQVNIPNRVVVAEGNGVLTRGDQVLRGERFDYNFGTNQGSILTARGELLLPATERDFDTAAPPEFGPPVLRPVTERVSANQPLQVLGGLPGPAFGIGNNASSARSINRLRFEADRAEIIGGNLVAENVSITNDPFSPPELELRSPQVTYTRLSPTQAEIRARNPRLVFDQGFSLPLLVNRLLLDSRSRDSGLLNFGYDEDDRDGFYIERSFNLYSSPLVSFSLTPQLLVQRAITQGGFPTDPDHYGLVADADFRFTPTTTAQAVANFSSLDFSKIEDVLRASFRAQQIVFNHSVALEYTYRNRLFNGSLGFQNVQSSFGLVVTSPQYVLGNSLINLRYQGSLQYINAQTDQRSLLPLDRSLVPPGTPDAFTPLDADRDLTCIDSDDRAITGNGCADLTRYQAAITLNRLFFLWTGVALPPTPTEGLRYSPVPITPYLGVLLDTRGVYSGYSSGDHQASLRGGVTLLGQFGHFSKPFFDYTAFNLGYAKTFLDGESPFLFDRVADEQIVSAGVTQQIYGPIRFGVQASYNLDSGNDIDTVFTLEYSRRTYSISATYSTGRGAATFSFRLNDFNWTGDPGPFSGLGSDAVEGGVVEGVN